MENEMTVPKRGGRPRADVTNQRICEIMTMYFRGGSQLGAIMNKLGVSQATASNLRKKAVKAIQVSREKDSELYQDKYILICRLEHLLEECWITASNLGYIYSPLDAINTKKELLKTKNYNLILTILKFLAEVNGHVSFGQTNFISIQQKILMNVLNLSEKDFEENNIQATMLKLADTYKNKLADKGIKDEQANVKSPNL